MSQSVPRIVIAGTQSGTGKTSLSLALVASLKRLGLRVQTFKVGPDFLDPSYLRLASGRPCYNLDGWMTPTEYVLELFHRTTKDVDIAVIEGVMGLFDGSDPATSEGSTAEIARWLDAPVLLIVNVHGMARSLAAIVKGYVEFEEDLRIAGIIANYSGSDHHKDWLTQSLESVSLPPVLGSIPRGAFPTLPSRHLGLVTADPQNLSPSLLEALAGALEKHVSIDTIIQIARSVPPLFVPKPTSEVNPVRKFSTLQRDGSHGALDPMSVRLEAEFAEKGIVSSSPLQAPLDLWSLTGQAVGLSNGVNPSKKRVSLGVAYDRAFHFYYPDNLDELALRGCNLIWFSPLEDRDLPEDLNGLYLGGGYPEEYAEALAYNQEMQEAIRQFAKRGLPIYAECGGLMYLTLGIETLHRKRYSMVGLLPVWSRMLESLKSLGYVEITLTENSLWGVRGTELRGHEFHYSELIGDPLGEGLWTSVYKIKQRRSKTFAVEGFQRGKVLASYLHLHWASQPKTVETFIDHCGAKP